MLFAPWLVVLMAGAAGIVEMSIGLHAARIKTAREFGFDQPRHADEQEEKAGDQASRLERQMINHA